MVHQKWMRMLKSKLKRVIGKNICVFKYILLNIYMCLVMGTGHLLGCEKRFSVLIHSNFQQKEHQICVETYMTYE